MGDFNNNFINILKGAAEATPRSSLSTDGTMSMSMGWGEILLVWSSAPPGMTMSAPREAGGSSRAVGPANGAGWAEGGVLLADFPKLALCLLQKKDDYQDFNKDQQTKQS